MKSAIGFTWLSRSGSFWLGTALSFAAFSWSVPATAAPELLGPVPATTAPATAAPNSQVTRKDPIAEKIAMLQQSEQRWIEVDLSDQKLIAWEGPNKIYSVTVSTGKTATPTVTGTFQVQTKQPSGRMRGPDYNVPYVPYIMYFFQGYAIHGAYWHNRFGTPVSHGCVNLQVSEAERLFKWASVGTPVVVHD